MRARIVIATVVAVALGAVTAASPATASGNTKTDLATKATVAQTPGSSASVDEIVKALEAEYGQPTVVRSAKHVEVSFSDQQGNQHAYTFTLASSPTPKQDPALGQPNYGWGWNAWYLNRAETWELYINGGYSAIIYAIGVVFGCVACAVGAAIEGYWATYAYNAYNAGRCSKIYYWLQIGEYSGGSCQ